MHASTYTTDAVPAEFTMVEHRGTRMLVRRGYERWAEWLMPKPHAAAVEWVRGGRAAHPLIALPNGERVVIRSFLRGGAMRHLNPRFYLLGHRAFAEVRATERARAGGVRTTTVLAATERRIGPLYTAGLATRWIADARDAARFLAEPLTANSLQVLREAGRQIAAMHAAGVAHPDLNLRNLLVGPVDRAAEAPLVYLLDFDRARVFAGPVPRTRRARDLRRLARSARKLQAPIDATGWRALRDGYGPTWPLDSPLG